MILGVFSNLSDFFYDSLSVEVQQPGERRLALGWLLEEEPILNLRFHHGWMVCASFLKSDLSILFIV